MPKTQKRKNVAKNSTYARSPPSSARSRPSCSADWPRLSHILLQDKDSLKNLNGRLAAYINKVRQLECERSGVLRELQTTPDVVSPEVFNVKGTYKQELQENKILLANTSQENFKLKLHLKKLMDKCKELKKQLAKKTKDCTNAEKKAHDCDAFYVNTSEDCVEMDVAKELSAFSDNHAQTCKSLEKETLCRIHAENRCQSLLEELDLKDKGFQQQLQDTRSRRQVDIPPVIGGRLSEQYVAKLQETQQELGDQQEVIIKANKDIEARVKKPNRNSNATTNVPVKGMCTRMGALKSQVNDLENKNATLTKRCHELECQMESERARNIQAMPSVEQEMALSPDVMPADLSHFAALMDNKTSSDHEISSFCALVELEEDRTNLRASPSASASASVSKSASTSASASVSESASMSASASVSESASTSASASVSELASTSASASASAVETEVTKIKRGAKCRII